MCRCVDVQMCLQVVLGGGRRVPGANVALHVQRCLQVRVRDRRRSPDAAPPARGVPYGCGTGGTARPLPTIFGGVTKWSCGNSMAYGVLIAGYVADGVRVGHGCAVDTRGQVVHGPQSRTRALWRAGSG